LATHYALTSPLLSFVIHFFHFSFFHLDPTGAFISAPLPPEAQAFRKGISGYQLPEGQRSKL
jgi:hypothetical protein